MVRMCVCMHSRFIENHSIRILEDGFLISEVVLSHQAGVLLCVYALIRLGSAPMAHLKFW
jgi:hypothetical protein